MREKLLVAGVILVALLGFSSRGIARVNINIEVPPLVISAPPAVVVIPGTYVYFCPDIESDLFFYDGYWYRPYEGNWYRSADYNGPWVYIAYTGVPYPVIHLPTDFRAEAVYAPRIPYRELRGNWRVWHRDKHWDRVGWGRRPGMEEHRHYGVAPSFGEHGHQPGIAPNGREQANPHSSQRHEMGTPRAHREMGIAPQFRVKQGPSAPHREMGAPPSHGGHAGVAPNHKEEHR